ncbi:MAG: anti-sigma factor family protein [Phycisphaerae bacterium]
MTPRDAHIPDGVDERVEHLISRSLDGEATAAERAELAGIVATDPSLRALLEDYRRIDAMAARALRADFARAHSGAGPRPSRTYWIAAAGAVLAAAAVIAFSFLPMFDSARNRVANRNDPTPSIARPAQPSGDGLHFVDYDNRAYGPRRRVDRVRRDLIGIRGENPNVIYLFERRAKTTRVTPVSGEF